MIYNIDDKIYINNGNILVRIKMIMAIYSRKKDDQIVMKYLINQSIYKESNEQVHY